MQYHFFFNGLKKKRLFPSFEKYRQGDYASDVWCWYKINSSGERYTTEIFLDTSCSSHVLETILLIGVFNSFQLLKRGSFKENTGIIRWSASAMGNNIS